MATIEVKSLFVRVLEEGLACVFVGGKLYGKVVAVMEAVARIEAVGIALIFASGVAFGFLYLHIAAYQEVVMAIA